MSALLEIDGLTKTYANGTRALKGIDVRIDEGEFLAVIGLSGSGKSTFLRCLNMLVEPSSGSIRFRGREVTSLRGQELRENRRGIGMIFQHFNLVKRRTVLENVLAGCLSTTSTVGSITGRFSEQDREQALANLEIVGIREKAELRADALSGGQQQRVAIARSLMQKPALLLADEPVASLDPATSHSVMKYLEYMNKELGTTVVCNLHFLSLVREYSTRVIALRDGQVVFEGKPEQITEQWFKEIYGEDAVEVEIR
jgi:phosphonate transport system ATP-binding protein